MRYFVEEICSECGGPRQVYEVFPENTNIDLTKFNSDEFGEFNPDEVSSSGIDLREDEAILVKHIYSVCFGCKSYC